MSNPYINKRQAAARAGVSPRRILELAADQVIRSRKVKDASHQLAVEVHQADLDKYIATFRKPVAEVMGRPERSDELVEKLAMVKAALLPAPEPAWKPWLSLGEGEAYTGLPASVLLMLIEQGDLPARDVGVRKGGRWRVRKVDLDAIAGVRQARGFRAAAAD